MPKPKTKTMDEFLANVSADKRIALQKLRRMIRAAVPRAQECLSYGIPAFRLDGKFLLGFGAGADHCSFYPGAYPIQAHRAALKKYNVSKGTIRFPAAKPLPAALVRKLVKARLAEYARRQKPKASRGAHGGSARRSK
jgi:uncharacterized protein YdhG (YjbR/CyaY superfamily)